MRFIGYLLLLTLLISFSAHAQLVGGSTYPINGTENPPTSFATMQSAVAYLNASGVTGTGDVLLEFATGYVNETDTIWIRPITGTSTSTRVVFRPAAGFTVNMSITPPNTTHPYVIRVAGSNIVLDGRAGGTGTDRAWTITALGSGTTGTGRTAVQINNTGTGVVITDVTLRYLTMVAEAANVTNGILTLLGSTANVMSNILIEQNLIKSTASSSLDTRGLGIDVAATISNAGNTGIVIRNNEITQFYQRAISYSGANPGSRIHDNRVYHTSPITQPTTAEFSAIYYSNSSVNGAGTEIYNNRVYGIRLKNASVATTAGISGIHFNLAPTSGAALKVYNNFVSIGQDLDSIAATYQVYGIRENTGTTGLVDVYFNSVFVGGELATGANNSAAFRKQLSTGMNISNNIFYNARSNNGGTGTHWGIMVNNTSFSSISNNDYFANGSGGVLGTTDGTTAGNRTTLSEWMAAVPADAGSVSQNPNYQDAATGNLLINAAIPTQLESGGISIAGITTDIEGDVRNATTPDIGADEFVGVGVDLSPPNITYTPLANTYLTTNRMLTATITDPSGVQQSTAGAPRLWFKKGAAGTYQQTTGVPTGDDFGFTLDVALVGGVALGDTVFYYVAAQDSLDNAGTNPGGTSPTINPPNATVGSPNSYVIVRGFAGVYTLGTGGDYATLKDFFDALPTGIVHAPVTGNIISDIVEPVSAVLGELVYDEAGPHTVTVRPSGAARRVSGAMNAALISLVGAKNLVIDGSLARGTSRDLTIENETTGTSAWTIRLTNGARNNTFMNVIVKGMNSSTTTGGVVSIGTSTVALGGNSNNTVENCLVAPSTSRPGQGIVISGTVTAGAENENNLILNNDVVDFSSHGIYLNSEAVGTLVEGNSVYHTGPSTATTVNGINILRAPGTIVRNNRVFNLASTVASPTISGIIYNGTTITTHNNLARIYNNMVSIGSANAAGTIRGIDYFGSTPNAVEIYFNSIYVAGTGVTGGTSAALVKRAASTEFTAKNNIAFNARSNDAGAGLHHAVFVSNLTSSGVFDLDHNDYYTTGTGGMLGLWGTVDQTTLADWIAASQKDSASISQDPLFVDPAANNLYIRTDSPSPADSAGTPIAGITTDIDGNLRNALAPDMGAVEFDFTPLDRDLWMVALLPPDPPLTLGDTVAFQAIVQNVSTTTDEPTYTINWFVGAVAQTPVVAGPLNAGARDTIPLSWVAQGGSHTVTAIVSLAGDLNPGNDTAQTSVIVFSPLSGTYTVGTTLGTFPTLKAAFDSINVSVLQGDVTLSFLAEGTTEVETANLEQVNYGSGGPYTITITPAAGASPTIRGNVFGFVMKFNGADNVIIDGSNTARGDSRDLTIENASQTTNSGVIWVASLGTNAGAENITIRNTNLIAGRNDTTNTICIFAAGQTIITTGTGAHNNNLVIENNTFQRARFGIYSRGVATTGIQRGLVIRNNVMGSDSAGYEMSYRGIDIANADSAVIHGNTMFNFRQPLGFTITGVHLDVNVSNATITNNIMRTFQQTNTGTFGALGININTGTGSTNHLIANNMISDLRNNGGGTSTVSNPFGIRVAGGTNHKVYYNSVSLTGSFFGAGTTNVGAAFVVTVTTATGLDLRNNIFSNTMTGAAGVRSYAIFASVANVVFGTINHNDYYVDGPNGVLARQSTTDIPTLAGWQAFTGQDGASVNGIPGFFDEATNLHIDSTQNVVVSNAGTPIAAVTTDIDGQERSATTPDIGADEFGESTLPGLSGNYNVGAGGHFPTLDSAFATLQAEGVLGPVTFNLIDSVYRPAGTMNEHDAAALRPPRTMDMLDEDGRLVTIHPEAGHHTEESPEIVGISITGPIPGVSATNRVTLRPATNVHARIVGTGAATFALLNVSYLTFDGIGTTGATQLSIENTATNGVAIALLGNSNSNIVQNLTLRAPYASGITVYADTASGAAPDSNEVLNNLMPVTSRGVYLRGGNFTAYGNRIVGNVIGSDSVGAIGIYNQQVNGSVIAGNHIRNVVDASAAGANCAGIWIATRQWNMRVYNNIISGVRLRPGATSAVFSAGIYYFGAAGDTSRSLFYNNMVYGLDNPSNNTGATVRGMYASTGIQDTFAFNSIYISGVDVGAIITSAMNSGNSTSVSQVFRNNILVNTRTATGTGRALAFYKMVSGSSLTSDYNDLYVGNTPGSHIGAVAGTNYGTLAAWQGAGFDANSVSVMPAFRGPHLHIDSTIVTPLDGGGTPIAGITTDIDGQIRNASSPDIGADEFSYLPPATFHVMPPAFSDTVGTGVFVGAITNTARTYQLLIHDSLLTSVAGKQLRSISWRLPAAAASNWPGADATFGNYDIYLSGSVPPSQRSLTFAENIVGPQTQVRVGSLNIPAGSYPSGGSPNAFGPEIIFDTLWLYSGGHLLIELRHTGSNSTSQSGDAITTTTGGYGTAISACWTGSYTGTSGSQGNFTIVRLAAEDTITVTVGEDDPQIPASFALSQNYPNPFNPSTTIRFALPTQSVVSLKIYNILGQEVATLVNTEHPAGFFTVEWNGRNQYGSPVASGVYFYRIEARAVDGSAIHVDVRKALMLK
jgi:hypothetical protein